jgi:hypothetical protein
VTELLLAAALAQAPVPPAVTRVETPLMSCWDRGASPAPESARLPRTVCVNAVDLELRWNRDGDLVAAGAEAVQYPGDELATSYGTAFGQTAAPLAAWRVDRAPLQARRADSGYRVELRISSGAPDADGRSVATTLVLYLDRRGKVLNHAVRGLVECQDERTCGPELGATVAEVPYARAP